LKKIVLSANHQYVVVLLFVFISCGLISSAKAADYKVGVNYHATGKDFLRSWFIKNYHNPSVRSTVRMQLQSMANSGAQVIQTMLQQVQDVENYSYPDENWRLAFPLSQQDLSNIRTYAQDVAAIQAMDGHRLELNFTMGWLGCADYTFIHTPGTITWCDSSWPTFLAQAKRSVSALLSAVSNIRRPDHQKVVKLVYLELEVMVGAKLNQDRFLQDLYPYFLTKAKAAGLPGSVYFTIAATDTEALDDTFTDPDYPAIDFHRSLYWVYRSTQFMVNNHLPVPKRLDASTYLGGEQGKEPGPGKLMAPYTTLVDRILDDIQAVYPGKAFAVSETYYFPNKVRRTKLGQAFANEYLNRSMPESVVFWSTPDGGGDGINIGFPFDFSAYQVAGGEDISEMSEDKEELKTWQRARPMQEVFRQILRDEEKKKRK
jgi:hypothetical protein